VTLLENKLLGMNNFIGSIEKRYWIFLIIWMLLNLLQAFFTFLHFDEAYYFMYSRNLAWGYFDHPPVVSALCWLGYSLFENELGLRLFHILLSTGTMYFIIRLLQDKLPFKQNLIVILSFPLVFFHIGGFLAIPDTALLFFTMFFLFQYKLFLNKRSVYRSVLLGVVGGLMVLSKYHGGILLVILFLSNFKLLRDKYAWIAVMVILVCLSPHLYWQVKNDFPTFSFHLSQRVGGFDIENVFHYIWGQMVAVGLLTGVIVLYAVAVFRPSDDFERGLKFMAVGFLLFFFLMSFRDNMEAHWTAIAMPAMMYALASVLNQKEKTKKWFMRLVVPSIVLVVLGRVFLLGAFPSYYGLKNRLMYDWKSEAEAIEKQAGGLPVLFFGSYKKASLYSFYTHTYSPAVPNYISRHTQFDLWRNEDSLIGRKVFIVDSENMSGETMTMPDGDLMGYFVADTFATYRNLKFHDVECAVSDSVRISGKLVNESDSVLNFMLSEMFYPTINFEDISDEKSTYWEKVLVKDAVGRNEMLPGDTVSVTFALPLINCRLLRMQIRSKGIRGDEKAFKL